MHEPTELPAEAEPVSRFLKFSRLGIIVALLLIAGGIGAVIYVNAMGGELYTLEETPDDSPFGDELNFGPDEQLMYTLSHIGKKNAADAVDKMVASGDKRFIPVLIEMIDAGETQPIVFGAGAHRHIFGLRKLANETSQDPHSAESLSRQWRAWYVTTDIDAPTGFTAWKGKLYGRFDHEFEAFFKNENRSRVRVAEILYGGVKVDEIPSLDRPQMLPADKADYLSPDEPVFGLEINGDARAYPQRILDWHEIINDEIGGLPVVLTYCPLSNSGIAYHARSADGKTLTFATSGLVYRSNKLMYDRESLTLWNQLTGTPALGPAATFDTKLKTLPVVIATWKSWKHAHPDTTVLDLNTGFKRRYQIGVAYGDYYSTPRMMFPILPPGDALGRKDHIYALSLDQEIKAFSVKKVAAERVVNDSVGNTPVVLVGVEGTIDVKGKFRRQRDAVVMSYNAGGEIRAYERGDQKFSPGTDDTSVVDSAGKIWKITEASLVGPDGQSLKRLPGFETYWFAWSQFHPDAPLYQ